MKMHCRDHQILAIYDDNQDILEGAHGEDVEIIHIESLSSIPAGYWSYLGYGEPPPPVG